MPLISRLKSTHPKGIDIIENWYTPRRAVNETEREIWKPSCMNATLREAFLYCICGNFLPWLPFGFQEISVCLFGTFVQFFFLMFYFFVVSLFMSFILLDLFYAFPFFFLLRRFQVLVKE